MAVKYKVVSKRPGGIAGERAPKYYPVITDRKTMSEREFSERVAERAGVHMGTVLAVAESLFRTIPELLMSGYNVKFNDLGTFSLHVSAEGKDTMEEVSAHDISKLKIAFLPSKEIKHRIALTKFEKK
jgi:predicted histone-like DNA-binding protein